MLLYDLVKKNIVEFSAKLEDDPTNPLHWYNLCRAAGRKKNQFRVNSFNSTSFAGAGAGC